MCLLLPFQIHRMLYLAIFSAFLDRLIHIEWQGRCIFVAIMLWGPNVGPFVHKVLKFLIPLALEKGKYQKYKTQTNRKQPLTPVLVAGRVRNFWWRFAPHFFKFFDSISDQKYNLTSGIHIGFKTKSVEILNYFTRIMVITRNLMFNDLKGTSYIKNSTALRDT